MLFQNYERHEEVMSIARNGIQVASSDVLCELGQKYQQHLDGLVLDMRSFNEGLFNEAINCGCKEAFRIMLIFTNDSFPVHDQ